MDLTKENKMGTAPMFKLIMSMSLPAMFSMLVQALYNVVDSYFVSKISEDTMTGVSLAYPMQLLMISVSVGTAIGINSLVSRRLGEKRFDDANSAASHGLILSFLSWVIFAIIGLTCVRPFISMFDATAAATEYAISYCEIVLIFSFGCFIEIAFEKTLQATGNMIYPMIFQLIGAIANVILDPIMIFGLFGFPRLEAAGAAIATVTGQILSMFFSMYVMFAKKHAVKIRLKGFKFSGKTVRDIYAVGFPSIIMQSIGSITTTAMNALLITFSQAAVFIYGVYFKLQSFIFMPVFGLTHGVMPIMGYNFGAKNKKRLMSALKIGTMIAVVIMFVGMMIFLLFPDKLLGIFNAKHSTLEIGIPALRTICLCFMFAALGIMFSTIFQATGNGFYSLTISVLRQLVLLVPFAFVLSKISLRATWFAFPLAEICSFAVSIIMLMRLYKKQIKNLG